MRIFAADLKVGDFIVDDGESFEILSIREFPISATRPQGLLHAFVDVMHSEESPFAFLPDELVTVAD